MRTYVPSGKFNGIGLGVAAVGGLIGAFVAGSILFWVEHLLTFSLILIFPAVAGLIAGIGLFMGVKGGKLRNPSVAAGLGLLTAIVLWNVDYRDKYQIEFLGAVRQELTDAGEASANPNTIADLVLLESTGSSGFMGFLKMQMNTQTSVSRLRSPRLALSGSNGVLMVVEFGIMAIVAGALGMSAAREPFDETTGEWYGSAERLFSISPLKFEAAFAAVNNSRLHLLPALGGSEIPQGDRMDIAVRRTSSTRSALLEITHHSLNEKGKLEQSTLMEGIIGQAQLEQLLGTAPAPEAEAPPPQPRTPLEELPVAPRSVQPSSTESGIKLGRG